MRRKNAHIILAWLALLLIGGCNRSAEDGPGEFPLVNLDISVSAGDVSLPASRASGENDAAAANVDEKMQKLRVIVVRPDGTVEHNRLVDPEAITEKQRFEVIANEEKQIYLFANEGMTTIKNGPPLDAVAQSLLPDFDFENNIKVGNKFPRKEVESLLIELDGNSEELGGPLPMSECHWVRVPREDHCCELFITRAAVKFSFVITNNGNVPLTLTRLTIDKMARKEYYLPKNTKYSEPDTNGSREIISFGVPSTGENEYYSFTKTFGDDGKKLQKNEKTLLDPIYLLEGKYTGEEGGNSETPYSISIRLKELEGGDQDGNPLTATLEKLPNLARNTHVLVNITINDKEVEWMMNVVPYGEVVLEPEFGLDTDPTPAPGT